MSSVALTSALSYAGQPSRVGTNTLFGRVMGLVALTVLVATLGVYVARDWGGAAWFIVFGAIFGRR